MRINWHNRDTETLFDDLTRNLRVGQGSEGFIIIYDTGVFIFPSVRLRLHLRCGRYWLIGSVALALAAPHPLLVRDVAASIFSHLSRLVPE